MKSTSLPPGGKLGKCVSAYLDNVSLEFPAYFLYRHFVFRLLLNPPPPNKQKNKNNVD